jgi:quercetin dioxygenase-like cupin family protein
MELPNGPADPARVFQGQRFVHHKADEATWKPFRVPGLQSRDTTIAAHTDNVAGVHVIRAGEGVTDWTNHTTDILFTFVMEGTMTLEGEGRAPYPLEAGDAFVIPPDMKTRYAELSADLELLEVSLPAVFDTIVGK